MSGTIIFKGEIPPKPPEKKFISYSMDQNFAVVSSDGTCVFAICSQQVMAEMIAKSIEESKLHPRPSIVSIITGQIIKY